MCDVCDVGVCGGRGVLKGERDARGDARGASKDWCGGD